MKNYYTKKQLKSLYSNICIICANNEQSNAHIINVFNENEIKHQERTLKTGDYCFKILADQELGFLVDTYFVDELFIERKNSLNELASSIKNESFHNELKRAQSIKHKYLIVEQYNGWEGILAHDYMNQYDPKTYFKTLHKLISAYDLRVIFCNKKDIAHHIFIICKSVLDNYILF